MFSKPTVTIGLLIVLLFAPKVEAITYCDPLNSSTNCLGMACGLLGQTSMDVDKKNIVACLHADATSLVWKAMTAGAAVVVSSPPPSAPPAPINCIVQSQVVGPPNCTPNTSGTLCPTGTFMTGRSTASDATQTCMEMTICSQVLCSAGSVPNPSPLPSSDH